MLKTKMLSSLKRFSKEIFTSAGPGILLKLLNKSYEIRLEQVWLCQVWI